MILHILINKVIIKHCVATLELTQNKKIHVHLQDE